MPNRVVHFEIPAHDLERAAAFYRTVFGWDIQKWEGPGMTYWMVMTGKPEEPGGINGGLIMRETPGTAEGQGANAFVCTIQVDDYDAMGAKILAQGGRIAAPKAAIPGMAWQGYFFDTENNLFGLHQADKNAA